MASHVAVMAPATNVGAASPVTIQGDIENETMKAKVTNDSVAYIKEIASLRGRNAEWAEQTVTDAASVGAEDALLLGVVEHVADDIDAVLAAVDGYTVSVAPDDDIVTIDSSAMSYREFNPSWRDSLLAMISNPAIAGILVTIGLYGLIGELYSGGATLVFGVMGVICLLLGLYALQLLPGAGVGTGLLLLGAVASLLGIAKGTEILLIPGLLAVFIGLLLLSSGTLVPLAEAGVLFGSLLFWSLVVLFVGLCMLSFLVLYAIRGSRNAAAVTGDAFYVGRRAVVVDDGHVSLDGVIWNVQTDAALAVGQNVRVTGVNGLILLVEPLPP